jgi:hypothetical protein
MLAGRGPLEPEHEPEQGRLAATVRPGDRDELAGGDGKRHRLEHGDSGPVVKRDVGELDDRGHLLAHGAHPSAFRSEARFSRITVK